MNYELTKSGVEISKGFVSELTNHDVNSLNSYFNQKSITDTLNGRSLEITPFLISSHESQYLLKSLFELQNHTNISNQSFDNLSISDEMLKCYSEFSESYTEFGKSIESTYSKESSIDYLAKDDLKFMEDVKEVALNSLSPFQNARSNFGLLNLSEDFEQKASLAVSSVESCINHTPTKQAPEMNKSNGLSLGSVER